MGKVWGAVTYFDYQGLEGAAHPCRDHVAGRGLYGGDAFIWGVGQWFGEGIWGVEQGCGRD